MKLVQASLIAVVAMVGMSANAASKQMYCGTNSIPVAKKDCKNITENRREELGKEVAGGNPVAITNEDGNLKVWYTVSGGALKDCQITNDVESFKISANPGDVASAYFLRKGVVKDIIMQGTVSSSSCPKADTNTYATNVVEYKVPSNGSSRVTMAARTTDNKVIILQDRVYNTYQYYSAQAADAAVNTAVGN